ncbi:MAG TPA: BamA/TamA family outer membrane protein [Thermoanaerobaculia bacterium]|nr:BamA/TamA family outer membrane protein [Thermoanaerobaculia bacterium]
MAAPGALVAWLALTLAGAAPPPCPPPVATLAGEGPPVTAIEIRSDIPRLDRDEVAQLLALAPGQPLTEEALRRTVVNLYATGVPGQVEVLSRPEGEGVRVVVALWAGVVIEEVELEAEPGTELGSARRLIAGWQGRPFFEDRVVRGVYALQDHYRERGHLDAQVRLRVSYLDPAQTRARVIYRIASGPQARISTVRFEGDAGSVGREVLLNKLAMAPGAVYRPAAAAEAARQLRRWLVRQGHGLARVEAPSEVIDTASGRVELVYPLAVGPKVELEVVGADRRDLEKRGFLPFLGDDGYEEALLLQSARRIRRFYQEKGFYRAKVTPASERRGDQLALRLTIEPGPEARVTAVDFEGNGEIPDDELARFLTTSARRLIALGSGRLVDEELAADLDNLRTFYVQQGFEGTRIGPARIEESEPGELSVVVPVVEGRRRRLGRLTWKGVTQLDLGALEEQLARDQLLRPGGPFHPFLLEETRSFVAGLYEIAGFDSARVTSAVTWDQTGDVADVEIEVVEGQVTCVGQVIVRGQRTTDPQVIRRALGLGSRQPVSRARLLEAQRNLYQLGAFSEVEVFLAPAQPGSRDRDLIVRVEEGKTRRTVYGLGYDTEDGLRGQLGFSHGNLFGRGFRLGALLRASERDQLGRLTLEQPYVGRFDLPLTWTLFYSDETREAFRAEKWGGRVEAVYPLFDRARANLVYDYRIVETVRDPLGPPDDEQPDRADEPVRISSLITGLTVDHRDDAIDPTRGGSAFVQLQYAFPLLSADEEFVKLVVQGTGYWSLGRLGVLAGSLKAGGIEPVGTRQPDPSLPRELPNRLVAISERFFGGGINSHRAFELDELGVPGETAFDGTAVGGNGLLLGNLELRFPVVGAVGGVVFVDAGNVWADWQAVDLAEARLGAGLGVRYLSPIGPFRLELGWKLDREHGESPYEIHFWLGNPF